MQTTLLPPTSGSARAAGFDIVRRASDARRSIGYVAQLLSADGASTGYENLTLVAELYDIPRIERGMRVRNSLTLTGLSEAADTLVRRYSGGMIPAVGDRRRRCCTGRAYCSRMSLRLEWIG
jgi:ABC-2 type transport system ATP-binding protein